MGTWSTPRWHLACALTCDPLSTTSRTAWGSATSSTVLGTKDAAPGLARTAPAAPRQRPGSPAPVAPGRAVRLLQLIHQLRDLLKHLVRALRRRRRSFSAGRSAGPHSTSLALPTFAIRFLSCCDTSSPFAPLFFLAGGSAISLPALPASRSLLAQPHQAWRRSPVPTSLAAAAPEVADRGCRPSARRDGAGTRVRPRRAVRTGGVRSTRPAPRRASVPFSAASNLLSPLAGRKVEIGRGGKKGRCRP